MKLTHGLAALAVLASSIALGGAAHAAPTTNPTTQPSNLVPEPTVADLPTTTQVAPSGGGIPTGTLSRVEVTSDLDVARDQISPPLGATVYTIGPDQIQRVPQGENAPFQQVLLRAPGVVEDSFGQVHVRGEHANLTYRVNGVILPEPLNGFGQELDTRLIDSVSLIDGSLPAQFGFRTAGIVDVTTKSGLSLQGSELSIYGGSNSTLQPSFETGGARGKWDYFFTGSYTQNNLGIENPTPSRTAFHDNTEQSKLFGYMSYHLDQTSRISLLLNGSYANFQIPNTPGAAQAFALNGVPNADSQNINENQNEQNYYSVLSYQKSLDNFSMQASAFFNYGQIHFTPDPVGDLIFQGVAGDVLNSFTVEGVQLDSSYILNDQHTLRGGMIASYTVERANTNTAVFPVDATGAQTSDVPFSIVDDSRNHALSAGIYLQDEWRINPALTLNYGARFDDFSANFDHESQFSPRANLVWKVDDATTAHVGYARYFVPPPVQYVSPGTIARFANTTNAPANTLDDPPKVERSNYFDVGVSHQFSKALGVNIDGYYKEARNLVDLGQFGAAVILSPFNYRQGHVYGADIGSTYTQGDFSAFGNFGWVLTGGRDIDSQQFLIGSDRLAFIQNHFIKLDHESEFTASAGTSYKVTRNDLVYADILYGSGLRAGFANQLQEPYYYPVNVGFEHIFHSGGQHDNLVKFRFDIVNLFDQSYQLRNGTGIGVGAPQYGQRRAFLFGLAYDF
ncbi:MAG: TonB-dependent receptor [Planctomycetota bacterium]|nr:TonB-dependent receptor [Planctomycetota bacterium]